MKRKGKGNLVGYAFVLPAVIYMLVFIGYPIVYNWVISFQDATAFTLKDSGRAFIGFSNYKAIFSDPTFAHAIQHTFIYTIGCLVIQFTIGFLLAMFFAKKFTFAKPIRGLVVISWMLPVTVTALVFKFMFSQDSGIINTAYIHLYHRLSGDPIYHRLFAGYVFRKEIYLCKAHQRSGRNKLDASGYSYSSGV